MGSEDLRRREAINIPTPPSDALPSRMEETVVTSTVVPSTVATAETGETVQSETIEAATGDVLD